jgi:hypothetical protein
MVAERPSLRKRRGRALSKPFPFRHKSVTKGRETMIHPPWSAGRDGVENAPSLSTPGPDRGSMAPTPSARFLGRQEQPRG